MARHLLVLYRNKQENMTYYFLLLQQTSEHDMLFPDSISCNELVCRFRILSFTRENYMYYYFFSSWVLRGTGGRNSQPSMKYRYASNLGLK
jgi:hypothetical protein